MLEIVCVFGYQFVVVCELIGYWVESLVGDLLGVVDLGLWGVLNYEFL